MENRASPIVLIVVPTLRISGGVQEAIRLATDLRERGIDAQLVSLWQHRHQLDVKNIPVSVLSDASPRKSRAAFQLPRLIICWKHFVRRLQKQSPVSVILTHYSTLPFGRFISRRSRYCFVQDLEWLFVPSGPLRWCLRRYILHRYAQDTVIAANPYLSSRLQDFGIAAEVEAAIWAAPEFSIERPSTSRKFDVAVVLRHGTAKRLDLYLELLDTLCSAPLRVVVATPEDDIAGLVSGSVEVCLVRPSREEIRSLFAECRTFVLLSEHEGFALPPLEAMGTGCIPVCRDSGGIRAYMNGNLARNVIPLHEPMETILGRLREILESPDYLDQSFEAASLFRNGLEAAAKKRRAAVDLLVRHIHHGAESDARSDLGA